MELLKPGTERSPEVHLSQELRTVREASSGLKEVERVIYIPPAGKREKVETSCHRYNGDRYLYVLVAIPDSNQVD